VLSGTDPRGRAANQDSQRFSAYLLRDRGPQTYASVSSGLERDTRSKVKGPGGRSIPLNRGP